MKKLRSEGFSDLWKAAWLQAREPGCKQACLATWAIASQPSPGLLPARPPALFPQATSGAFRGETCSFYTTATDLEGLPFATPSPKSIDSEGLQ